MNIAIRRLTAITLVLCSASVSSQIQYERLVTTETGCRAHAWYLPENKYQWTGYCVDGFAEGRGQLIIKLSNPPIAIFQDAIFHQGKRSGYYSQSDVKSGGKRSWFFRNQSGAEVAFSEGAGLSISEKNAFGPSTIIPSLEPVANTLESSLSLFLPTSHLNYYVSDCDVWSSLPFCQGKGKRKVFFFQEGTGLYRTVGSYESCPQPHSPADCGIEFARKSESMRHMIVSFISQHAPANDTWLRLVATTVQTEASKADTEKAKVVEAQNAFSQRLTTMNPGQLFAMADEFVASGDIQRSRAALRALLQRFPDHQLATIAATQLGGKPASTSTSPTKENRDSITAANQSEAPRQAAPAQSCRPTLAFLDSRLPRFSASEINGIRQQILQQSVTGAIALAKQQGHSMESATKAALAQAREHDRVSRESAQCAADVDAMGASDDEFLTAMRNGSAPAVCTGIRNACICSGVINRLAAVATRALAAEMQCFARNER